jgi:hypothetical protein
MQDVRMVAILEIQEDFVSTLGIYAGVALSDTLGAENLPAKEQIKILKPFERK